MPYGISENQEDCAGWATVKVADNGRLETIGCHEIKQDAIDQMIAASLSEDMEPLGEVRSIKITIEIEDEESEDEMQEPSEAILDEEELINDEGMMDDEDSIRLEERAVDLAAPEFMRSSAERGLELHEQGYSGDGLQPETVADARRMAAGEVSEDKWRKIAPWIARHIGDLDAVEDGEITAGLVSMLLWGGGSTRESALRAQDYAERIVEALDEDELNSEANSFGADMTTIAWVEKQIDEKRSVAYSNLELRASEDGTKLIGYAAVFDSPSEPMPFTEYVRRGAFQKTLKDGADVRLLIDHEGIPLARTKSGTLMLMEDDRGLRVEANLDPSNPDAARVISAMKRGDMSQMSFAFRTIKDQWNADRSVRELKEVQLFDVSVVTFPAYEETVAELRKREITDKVPSVSNLNLRKRQIEIERLK